MVQTTKWVLAWLVFTALAVIGGEVYDLYEELYWYDLMLHTASGFMLLLMYDTYNPIRTTTALFMAGCAVANALVVWEIFEFFMDRTLDLNMQKDGIQDTMEDIIVGKAGCVVAMAYVAIRSGVNNAR